MLHEKAARSVRVGNVGRADAGGAIGIGRADDSANAFESKLEFFRLWRWRGKKASLGETGLDRNDLNFYARDRGGERSVLQVKADQVEEKIFVLRGSGEFPDVDEFVMFRRGAIFGALSGDASRVSTQRILEMLNVELQCQVQFAGGSRYGD